MNIVALYTVYCSTVQQCERVVNVILAVWTCELCEQYCLLFCDTLLPSLITYTIFIAVWLLFDYVGNLRLFLLTL